MPSATCRSTPLRMISFILSHAFLPVIWAASGKNDSYSHTIARTCLESYGIRKRNKQASKHNTSSHVINTHIYINMYTHKNNNTQYLDNYHSQNVMNKLSIRLQILPPPKKNPEIAWKRGPQMLLKSVYVSWILRCSIERRGRCPDNTEIKRISQFPLPIFCNYLLSMCTLRVLHP
jgi:hypothetical protein